MAGAITYAQAIDDVYGVAFDAWQEACAAQSVAPPGEIIFDNLRIDELPTQTRLKPWGRVTHAMTGGTPRSVGGRLWQIAGGLTFDIYVPFQGYEQKAGTVAQQMAEIVLQHFRRYRGSRVTVANVAPREPIKDGPFYSVPVLVEFSYYTTA